MKQSTCADVASSAEGPSLMIFGRPSNHLSIFAERLQYRTLDSDIQILPSLPKHLPTQFRDPNLRLIPKVSQVM